MKRLFFFSSVVFSLCILPARAVTVPPTQTVWFTPTTAVTGDAITLEAFVYNGTAKDATMVVQFQTAQNVVIGKQTLVVPTLSARTAIFAWKMPTEATTVIVKTTSAFDAKKIELKELIGEIGTTVVQAANQTTSIGTSEDWLVKLTAWWNTGFSISETWRIKEAAYFRNIRDAARIRVGITPSPQIDPNDTLNPEPPQEGTPEVVVVKKLSNPLDYTTVLFAGFFTFFFSNELVFYILGGLLIIFILRFLYTRFI